MTKQPKEFKSLPSAGSSFGTSGEWKEMWKKIASENEKIMAQYMQDTGAHPYSWLDAPLFKPEEITHMFTQTMRALVEQAESANEMQNARLVDVQAFLRSTMDFLQAKTIKGPMDSPLGNKGVPSGEGEENPFFFLLQQSYLLNMQFLKEAVSRLGEIDPHMSRKLTSYTRHLVDILSFATFPLKNAPDLQETFLSHTLSSDRSLGGKPSGGSPSLRVNPYTVSKGPIKAFQLGENLAVTPGKVVFQNELFQLIWYEPLASRVAKRPLFIVPPWTHKYYIFDLSPENSFIQRTLESGLTVFVLSWINPDERHDEKTLTDYVLRGVKAGLDQVCKMTREEKVNVLGYCSGGSLLGGLTAYLKAKKDKRIASAAFLATPFDFSKMDELGIYRCKSQQQKLEEYGEKEGNLEGQYMVQAFNLLWANDLIWSSDVNHYLLGRASFPFDMLHWTCDALRVPVKMHSAYLRELLIENRLMKRGRLFIDDIPLNLRQISAPLFVMAAHEDHLAPWRSAYALTQTVNSPSQKFILSSSGHMGGVFNHPSAQKHYYRLAGALPQEADHWLECAQKQSGSWWKEWRQWIDAYGGGMIPACPIPKDYILEDAPGGYAIRGRE